MKHRPVYDKIVIKIVEAETATKSGIVLTDNSKSKEPPQQATVMAVGPIVENIKPGDTVLFDKYAILTGGVAGDFKWGIIAQDSVMAVIE